MKKLLVIFYCIFGMIPMSAYAEDNRQRCINSIQKSTAVTTDDLFCWVYKNGKKMCFKADSSSCVNETIVCILGNEKTKQGYENCSSKSTQDFDSHTVYKCGAQLLGIRTCATSYTGNSDTWYDNTNTKKPITFSDCTAQKWKKNDEINKNNEVMVINKKAVLSTNGYTMEWWVAKQGTSTYPQICVGYYCKDISGKYTEPCDDGSCSPSCSGGVVDPTTTNPEDQVDPANDPIIPDPGSSSSTLSKKPDKNKDYANHKNTVNDWLEILKKKSN